MTIEVWNPAHPHHAVWREYTQSLLDGKQKVVECRNKGMEDEWSKVFNDPTWSNLLEYRIARPMLKLSYEVQMPVNEALKKGQDYWLASSQEERPTGTVWNNDAADNRWLRAGLIYLTEADAQAAIDARNAAMTAALEGAK